MKLINAAMQATKQAYIEIMDRKHDGAYYKGWFSHEHAEKISEMDYVIEFVKSDDERLGGSNTQAIVDHIDGGRQILINESAFEGITSAENELDFANFENQIAPEIGQTIVHEMGHLLGLIHPWDQGVPAEDNDGEYVGQIRSLWDTNQQAVQDVENEGIGSETTAVRTIRNNVMNSPANKIPFLSDLFSTGKELTDDQFGTILREVYDLMQSGGTTEYNRNSEEVWRE